jgi:hypothetical protein
MLFNQKKKTKKVGFEPTEGGGPANLQFGAFDHSAIFSKEN